MSNDLDNHGWDFIAAATQKGLNAQLSKISSVMVNKTTSVQSILGPTNVVIAIDVGAPQLSAKPGESQILDVIFTYSGTVTITEIGDVITMPAGTLLTVTTTLSQIRAELQPDPSTQTTSYDLILDILSPMAVVNVTMDASSSILAFLAEVLEVVVQKELGDGSNYIVASFDLQDSDVAQYKAFIPRSAGSVLVYNYQNVDESNLLVLMNSVTTAPGDSAFDRPLLPTGQDFMVLMSNKLFLSSCIQPALITSLQGTAVNPSQVAGQITLTQTDAGNDYWQIKNTSNIPIKQDHDPWISSIQVNVDTSAQEVLFYIDAQADVTSLNPRVEEWDQSWQAMSVDDNQVISMKQTQEKTGTDTRVEWWELFLAAIQGVIALLALTIVDMVDQDKAGGLGGTFKSISTNTVKWPGQKVAKLTKITTPGHVVMFVDVEFN